TVAEEVYRVLKPGGKILAVTPARYDVDYWQRVFFPWPYWWRRQPFTNDSSHARFTARGLRRLFNRFAEHRVYKRPLRRSEVPPLGRWLPLPLLERLLGRVLILKAFKPLSAATALQMVV